MSDILSTSFWFPRYRTRYILNISTAFSVLSFGNRQFGLFIILLLAVVRFIMIFFPLSTSRLLSRFRMKVALASLLAVCLALQTFDDNAYRRGVPVEHIIEEIITKVLCCIASTSLQNILMTAVTWKVWRVGRVALSLPETSSVRPDQPEKTNTRRFFYVVLAICVTSFIVYAGSYLIILFFLLAHVHETLH